MPEPEFANLEAKIWLPSRRTALAHFDFKVPKAKTSCINEEQGWAKWYTAVIM